MPYYSTKPELAHPFESPKPVSSPPKQTDDELHFMTVTEVAKLLHIGSATVYRLADRGEIPSYKILRKRLFKRKDAMAYIEKCAVPRWKQ